MTVGTKDGILHCNKKKLTMDTQKDTDKSQRHDAKWSKFDWKGYLLFESIYRTFLGFKITADGDCSHEIKRRLLLGRKAVTNLDSILKSRGITLPTKVHILLSYGFSISHVWMWELDYKESWALKNWCFELWRWRRLSRVPWTARRSNQSILKEISPEYSLEGLMLKLKL